MSSTNERTNLTMSRGKARTLAGAVAALLIVGAVVLWMQRPRLPQPGSEKYERYVEAFSVGVAALDADVANIAEEHLTTAIQIIPEEPAAWANRGLLYLRTERLTEAAADLEQAYSRDAENPEINRIRGLLARRQGQLSDAMTCFRDAVDLAPNHVKTLYLLNEIVEQENLAGSTAERLKLHEQMLSLDPHNLKLLLNQLKLAIEIGDKPLTTASLQNLREQSTTWSEQSRQQLEKLEQTLASDAGASAKIAVMQFANVLLPEPAFRESLMRVADPETLPGSSLQSFLRLAPVESTWPDADYTLTFQPEPVEPTSDASWDFIKSAWLDGDHWPTIVLMNSNEIRAADSSFSIPSVAASDSGMAVFDINNDRRCEVFLAGEAGLKFLQADAGGQLADKTSTLGLSPEFLAQRFATIHEIDADHDGDVDILLSTVTGSPRLLRNNFDGTMTPLEVFADASGPQRFACCDVDNDGDIDIAMLDAAGELRVFANERMSEFRRVEMNLGENQFASIAVADVTDDGTMDLVVLRADRHLVALSWLATSAEWSRTELGAEDNPGGKTLEPSTRLICEDFDNNGLLDFLASNRTESLLWLGSGNGQYSLLETSLPTGIQSSHLTSGGQIELLGLNDQGQLFQLRGVGKKGYHWQLVRLRAAGGAGLGDNRINSFAIGGTVEVRTGTQVITRPVEHPVTHVGLGNKQRADILRIVWPNGTAQYEFLNPIDSTVDATQRLKGSCPFLFTWDGKQFEFATDFMWSTPLGMYINASNKGGFLQTTDWVKVPGEQVVEKDGFYELRINANLWETHFFDHLALMAVDHPEDTHLFVDERFHMRPTAPSWYLTRSPLPPVSINDHHGNDASKELQSDDGVYLDRCGRGLYQGITCDHWIEVSVGELQSDDAPVFLIARGWIHPTDSSVNYAIEQGQHVPPSALTLELPDGNGGWKTGMDQLGFPAGKNKTLMIRLDGLEDGKTPRRFRLRTNMEIYWDSIRLATGADPSVVSQQRLEVHESELRFRGFIDMTQQNSSSPEIPHYNRLVSRRQIWRDLIGYHTRFGDIRDLLRTVDDRYAIVNAGDEIHLRFKSVPNPPHGMKRDFVFVADGWVKDGDFNTRFGKTVLPLPAHDSSDYRTPPIGLDHDPVAQRHEEDWLHYHTRYVAPEQFSRGLRSSNERSSVPSPRPVNAASTMKNYEE